MQHNFQKLRTQLEKDSDKAAKLEAKINLYNGGYMKRHDALQQELEDLLRNIANTKTQLRCFQAVAVIEDRGARNRLEGLKLEVKKQSEEESLLQKRYGELQRLIR